MKKRILKQNLFKTTKTIEDKEKRLLKQREYKRAQRQRKNLTQYETVEDKETQLLKQREYKRAQRKNGKTQTKIGKSKR